jgi:signal transduction histidine kinase
MKTRVGKFIILILMLTLVLAVGDVFSTYQNLVSVHDSGLLLTKTYQVNLEFDKTLTALANAETAERGFIITNDDAYLLEYTQFLFTLRQNLSQVNELTKDNPQIQKEFSLLQQKIQERLLSFQEAMTVRNEKDFATAQQFVSGPVGRQKIEEIRSMIQHFENQENALLKFREAQTETMYMTLFVSSTFAGVLSISLLIICYYFITREFSKRTQLEKNKDDFFNMASHELKTPITSLNIFLHVLRKKIIDDKKEEAGQYLGKMEAQTAKLTSLITDFLDLTRIHTGKMRYESEPFDLDGLIANTVEEIQGTTKRHEIHIQGSLTQVVMGDRYRIYQVLVNLITNAVKYSPEGGEIIIIVKKENNTGIVGIQDGGIGIEKKYHEKIFERLYQIQEKSHTIHQGFGIGLYVSREIIRHHKGDIWVESQKGKGSRFYFSLPLQENLDL